MVWQKQYRQSHHSGLEVVPDYSGLQAVPEPSLEVAASHGEESPGYYAAAHQSEGSISPSILYSDKMMATETETVLTENSSTVPERNVTPSEKKSYRRMYIVIGAIACIFVLLAAILGGVLASRKSGSDNDSSDSSHESSSPTQSSFISTTLTAPATASSVPTAVAPYSRLSAAAWQAEGGFTRLLFYQDSNQTLRYSLAAGSGNLDQSSWDESKILLPQFPVENVTGMATGILSQRVETPTVQLEIFYLNQSSVINAMNYVRAHGFSIDSINEKKYQALEGSDLAAYWPYTLYQSLEGMLQLITFPWRSIDLKIRARRGSKLALVPTSRNFTRVGDLGRWAMLYQNEEGKLIAWEDPATQGASSTYTDKNDRLEWNSTFPDVKSLDTISAIAAFSLAASNKTSEDSVNTFVLYQDDSNIIQQIWRDGTENKWYTSTPDAFKGADKGGSIACITTPMWLSQPVLGERLLEPASDLTHCFFMKGGSIMEVQLNGTDWNPRREIAMQKVT